MPYQTVADANIPYAQAAFGTLGHVRRMRAEDITPTVCQSADALLVRSVTKIGYALLSGSRVRFVGSATAGTEHVDTDYLARNGIAFAHAPGSNAGSVVEYVLTALLNLSARFNRSLRGRTLGVIGCGHIGGRLAVRARALGLRVLQNDPPRQARGEKGFVSLTRLLGASDIVTLHVPLTEETHQLVNRGTLSQMRTGAWLVNTSRGAVADGRALKHAVDRNHLGAVVLDVWENEPHIDAELLNMVALGTPHIAGYSIDGKIAGTIMLYEAAVKHFGLRSQWRYDDLLKPDSPEPLPTPDGRLSPERWLRELAHAAYDLDRDDRRLRQILMKPDSGRANYFRRLRATYPRRRAFETHRVAGVPLGLQHAVEAGLAMRTA